jgi:uncharacterized membrane protein YbaN (DUF454 family)
MYSSITLLYSPHLFNILSPAVHKLLYVLRRKCFWLSVKACMHHFFHSLIAGEIVASQIVFEWTKQVTVRKSWIRTIQRMLNTLKFSWWRFPTVWAAVCKWTLLCNIVTAFDKGSRHLVQITGPEAL